MDWLSWVTLGSTTLLGLYTAVTAARKVISDKKEGIKGHELAEARDHVVAQNEFINQHQEDRVEMRAEIKDLKAEVHCKTKQLDEVRRYNRTLVDFIYRHGMQPPTHSSSDQTEVI